MYLPLLKSLNSQINSQMGKEAKAMNKSGMKRFPESPLMIRRTGRAGRIGKAKYPQSRERTVNTVRAAHLIIC